MAAMRDTRALEMSVPVKPEPEAGEVVASMPGAGQMLSAVVHVY